MDVRPYEGGRFEPQRQVSSKQYTERRTYGRDENGEIVVKIEKNPAEPVRPASPVRPVTPVGEEHSLSRHLLQPIQPLHIPRIDIQPANSSRHASPRHKMQYDEVSPRSGSINMLSPRSGASSRSGAGSRQSNVSVNSQNLPMKKVTKKSRWVSIHDGRPVSPYTEKVSFEVAIPVQPDRYSSASARSYNSSPLVSRRPSECAYLMENPLYQD
ncbi:Protein CBG16159 [Caenorhabditis briggsae]|uniref:Protein CBG16159 n=1 Tax=Caenorhabditis briggsae TaxID=6238 RepID=A8XNZ8_CAEBR|nr:Protein CBG16159 [Caenorhabditis briggsae]CAP34238.2 Protein CBG16159 [Caenorhabditis briggsae]